MPFHFIGRDGMVSELVARLTSGEECTVALEGMPGVGKTTLATALAHRKDVLAYFRDGVLWASLGPQGNAYSALANWAQALGKDITKLTDLEDRHEVVKQLIGQRRILLVIDDVWDIQTALDLQCGGPNCCHLLTSRELGIAEKFAGKELTSRVPTLEDEASYQLMKALAPEACETDPAAARKLSDALGGLPLALRLVGGYLAAPERTVFSEVNQAALADMTDPARRLELASVRLGARRAGEVTLKETILFSLETLSKEAQAAFYALGAFAPKPHGFSREAAKDVAQTDDRTLALLIVRNLLEKTEKIGEELALHQTLADLACTILPPEMVARHRDYYLALVKQDPKAWHQIGPVYGQIQWAWAKLPEDEGLLCWIRALLVYQQRRGLWRDQIAWIKRGLLVAEVHSLRRDQGELLNYLGIAYSVTGQLQKALELHKQALAIYQEVGDRKGEAITLNNMGEVYSSTRQPYKALYLFDQALPIMKEEGDRKGEAATLNNKAELYQAIGQPQMALKLYEQALPIWQEVGERYGEATNLNNIAAVYSSTEQPQRALELFNQALAIYQEVGDRAGEALMLNNMGKVSQDIGQWQKALGLYEQALPIWQEVGDRKGEAITLPNMAEVYRVVGQLQKMLELYDRALPIMKELGDRVSEACILNNIGEMYRTTGQPRKALELYEQALPIRQEVGDRYGESVTRYNLALVYQDQGHLEEAATELRTAIELVRRIGHPDLERDSALLRKIEGKLKRRGWLARFHIYSKK